MFDLADIFQKVINRFYNSSFADQKPFRKINQFILHIVFQSCNKREFDIAEKYSNNDEVKCVILNIVISL